MLTPFGWLVLTTAINKIISPKTFILDTVFRPKKNSTQQTRSSFQSKLEIKN